MWRKANIFIAKWMVEIGRPDSQAVKAFKFVLEGSLCAEVLLVRQFPSSSLVRGLIVDGLQCNPFRA
ncbi:hypothetical protein D3C75_649240 [compost metagenome]